MKLSLSILLFCILSSINSFSQAPDWQWAHESGSGSMERGEGICYDPSNNDLVVIGFFQSAQIGFSGTTPTNAMSNLTSDILLVRYNSVGTLLWAKSFGGSGSDRGNAVVIDGNGDIIITGHFDSPTISFGSVVLTSSGESDCFIVKLDANGNTIWARHSNGIEDEYGNDIAVDNAGNIAVVGYFRGASFSFGSHTGSLIGANSEDVFTVKYNSSGTSMWVNVIGGTKDENSHGVLFDSSGDVVICGSFNSVDLTVGSTVIANYQVNTYDGYVIKYNSTGSVSWVTGFGGFYTESALGMAMHPTGDILLTGYYESATLPLGSITLVNTTTSGWYDMFVARLNSTGAFLWATSAGGNLDEHGSKISTDVQGNFYVSGHFDSDTLSIGSTSIINNGSFDLYTAAFSSAGTLLWTQSAGGNGVERCGDMCVNGAGAVAMTGYFDSNTLNFGNILLDNSGDNDFYVARMDEITGLSQLDDNDAGMNVYSYQGTIYIDSENLIDEMVITNALGQIVEKRNPAALTTIADLNLPGIYIISVLTGDKHTHKKILITKQ